MAASLLGGWFGQALVQKLMDNVASYIQGQIQCEDNTRNALQKLHDVLLPIQIAVEEAEKVELDMEKNSKLVEWVWKLRDVVEEADDVLDEMEYYRIEQQVLKRDAEETVAISSKFKVHGYKLKDKFVKFGRRALKMNPMLDKLNVVVSKIEVVNNSIYVLKNVVTISPSLWGGVGNNNNIVLSSRETGYVLTVDKVLGRDEDRQWVLEWLTNKAGNDRHSGSNISALTIWGIGGVGKTTLAQVVYNDEGLKDYFQVKMWVCVSNNQFNIIEMMKKAIQSATKCSPKANFMIGLQEELKDIVSSKKFLLILDDVWDNENSQNQQLWENFIGLLSIHAETGSKILITSRTKNVAELILQGLALRKEYFHLGCLQTNESLSLLNKHAFVGLNIDQYFNFQPIAKKIAEKCGGLPLALMIIGGLLNNKLDYNYWRSISEKDILDLGQGISNIMNVLKFSYRRLPSNLQFCFKICALFPQDYKFNEEELIALWMAIGCIKQSKDENRLLEDIGRETLAELVRRSFLIFEREGLYTIHDLLHDLARDVSKGECLRINRKKQEAIPKTLRHLFVDQFYPNNWLNEISSLQKLQTISLTSINLPIDQLNEILMQLKALRALFLKLKYMPSLDAIGHLKHLKLLNIVVEFLDKPLKPLYKLYQLQNLKCTGRSIILHRMELDGIGNLVKLRHLHLDEPLFNKITQLRLLTELQEVQLHLKEDNTFQLSDLKDLNKLCHLDITLEREVISVEETEKANLGNKNHLESLSLSCNNHDYQLDEQIYNFLQPQSQLNIKHLQIINYEGKRVPSWMTCNYLPYVTHIQFSYCNNLECLPLLGQLPSLTVLILKSIHGVEQLGAEFFGGDDSIIFPSLVTLEIADLRNWKKWNGNENSRWFPSLENVSIHGCNRLKKFFPLSGCVFLRYLSISFCKSLRELPALPLSLKRLHLQSLGLIVLPSWQEKDVHMHEQVNTSLISTTPALEVMHIVKS